MAKRYYWLKLSEDFFSETCIKALRRLPSGDSLVIVYLKMQLKSLKTEGLLKYCGLLPDSTAELAMALDEDENIVRLTIEALIRFKMIERWEDETLYVSAVQELIGSEGDSAERVRKHRQMQKQIASRAAETASESLAVRTSEEDECCNSGMIESMLHCNRDIEIGKEIESEKDTPPVSPAGGNGASGSKQSEQRKKIIWERFALFWEAYPRKQGQGAAEDVWKKLRPSAELTRRILDALEQAKRCPQWQREGGRYIPYPANWLERRQWTDELRTCGRGGMDGLGTPSYDLEEIERLIVDSAVRSATGRGEGHRSLKNGQNTEK